MTWAAAPLCSFLLSWLLILTISASLWVKSSFKTEVNWRCIAIASLPHFNATDRWARVHGVSPGCEQIPASLQQASQPVEAQEVQLQSSIQDGRTWGPCPRWCPPHPRSSWRFHGHARDSGGFSFLANPRWHASTRHIAPSQCVWCVAGSAHSHRVPTYVTSDKHE